jgi:hypothetical protein
MHFLFRLAVVVMCLPVSLGAVAADKTKTGSIQGSVNFCGQGGVEGMQVYIPGLPYVVITGADGRFQLPKLPPGSYDLHYRLGERLLNRNAGVKVMANLVTDLSVISFCDHVVAPPTTAPATSPQAAAVAAPEEKTCAAGSTDPACQDADGDGVVAARDCDDHNAKIHPGAVESCDGVDNNCNGQVDENALVMVLHGMGSCQSGQVIVQQCQKGFSDCDGQASNGCEVDIENDPEHCGSCSNACTPTELCIAGGCE